MPQAAVISLARRAFACRERRSSFGPEGFSLAASGDDLVSPVRASDVRTASPALSTPGLPADRTPRCGAFRLVNRPGDRSGRAPGATLCFRRSRRLIRSFAVPSARFMPAQDQIPHHNLDTKCLISFSSVRLCLSALFFIKIKTIFN